MSKESDRVPVNQFKLEVIAIAQLNLLAIIFFANEMDNYQSITDL
jgi:hypothetical protein